MEQWDGIEVDDNEIAWFMNLHDELWKCKKKGKKTLKGVTSKVYQQVVNQVMNLSPPTKNFSQMNKSFHTQSFY